MWHSAIGDDGACALAELLRLGGAEVTVEYMEVRIVRTCDDVASKCTMDRARCGA
jgi:hypothetical protein